MTPKSLPKPPVKNAQIQEYIEAASRGGQSQIVVAVNGGWIVRSLRVHEAPKAFKTKEDALVFATKAGGNIIFPDEL